MPGGITVNGIRVINIPHDRDNVDAYIADFFLKIAERYASGVPEKLRRAVALDFERVPDEALTAWGEVQRKPPSEAELRLVKWLEELEKSSRKEAGLR